MRAIQLTMRRSCKVNLGHYENTDIDASITMTVEESETVQQVHDEAIRHVHGMIRSELVRLKKDPTHYGV